MTTMYLPIESLALIMYLDSLVAEGGDREVKLARVLPPTLTQLYLHAMREHARPSLLLHWREDRWQAVPDWRFDRQVIRLALYLRERVGVGAGDRVAVISELRPEWLLADLAATGLGAVSVVLDPGFPAAALASALAEAAPRAVFASTAALVKLGTGDGRGAVAGELIAFDEVPSAGAAQSLVAVLDLGGTLDTAERAQDFRGRAREIQPSHPALRHCWWTRDGRIETVDLTQGEVIERLHRDWMREPARAGDVALVAAPAVSLGARLALYGFLGDGVTTTVLAVPGREASDLADHHPHKIVAPGAVLAEVLARGVPGPAVASHRGGGWLRGTARLAVPGRTRRHRRAIRDALGGRARWIGPTDPLDGALAETLGAVVSVGTAIL